MTEREQTFQFGTELDKLVDRFRQEYDMSYAAIVGTLVIKAHLMSQESAESEGDT